MSRFKIPPDTRQFSQANDGDLAGNLWLTQNIDLKSNKGKLRVSPRLIISKSSSDDADLGRISAFAQYVYDTSGGNQGFWCQAGTVLFKSISAGGRPSVSDFVQDSITNTPTDLDYRFSDMIVSPLGLLVSTDDNIYLFNGSAWSSYWKTTLSQTFYNPVMYHMMEVLYNTNIAISDDYKINLIVSPYTDGYETLAKVTLRPEDRITWIKSSSTRVWVGTYNTAGGEGLVYEWDGASTNTNRAYKVGATGALAGLIKDDVPYIVTSDGSLKAFNGSGFATIAQLPHTSSSFMLKSTLSTGITYYNERWIHPNGMKLIDGNINILINNILNETTDYTNLVENEPAGIWEYDEKIGLVHKYSPTLDATGDLDSGQNAIGYAGALFETKIKEAALLAGMSVYTDDATTLKHAIFYDELPNTIAKVGRIVTPWLQTSEIDDVWQKIWLKFKEFDNATDEIIVKYRTRKDENLPLIKGVTWTSTTTFTCTSTTDLEATTNVLDVGNEVEIIMASGSGKSAHISSVTTTGSYTHTVTIDEAIGPASGTGKVRFNNWTKIETADEQSITNKLITLGENAVEIQILLELRGTGDNPELNQLVVLSQPNLKIT